MVISTLCPAVHILGSQNVYTVQQGRGYCWPLLALGRLFFMVLCLFSWSQQNFMVIASFYDVGKLWFLLFMKCAKVHGFCLFLWSWHIFIVFAFLHEVVKISLFLVETMRLYVDVCPSDWWSADGWSSRQNCMVFALFLEAGKIT